MRPVGTTRVKKPIFKKEFDRLIKAVKMNTEIKSPTKLKLTRAFTLLYLTGCRAGEIVKFTRDDLEQMISENEYSLTNSTKTKTPRLISFDETQVQIGMLRELLPMSGTYLFPKNGADHPMTTSAFKLLMNGFIQTILGELYSTHSFRKGYITTAHNQGLSIEHIRTDIGHRSLATTAKYIEVTHEEISRGKNHRVW
jgi:integrase